MSARRILLIMAALSLNLGFASAGSQAATRQITSLDPDWKFHLGDIPAALNPGFDDRDWRQIDVPHDYIIQTPFDPNVQAGMKPDWYANHASIPLQPAWYRKIISIPASSRGKRLWIEFDGVFSNSQYWLNGHDLGSVHSGYSSFRFDITGAAKFGADNILAVRVDPHYDGWWYEGGGIYRHVRLVTLDPIHVAPWGAFVAPSVANPADGTHADANLAISTQTANDSAAPVTATVLSEIIDPAGSVVLSGRTDLSISAKSTATAKQNLSLPSAALWSVEHPSLYELRSTITVSGKIVDELTTHFGVRQIRFDPDEGFFLNGRHVEIKGVNCHQDHAGVGIAMPDRLIEWRLERLKELGCNAIRLSHNPVEPAMLDFCDRMGFLIIAENRHLGDTYADQTPKNTPAVEHHDLTSLVMRDRNHPSIILWSLCNEQWTQGSPEGAAMARAMKQRVNDLDGTRPITAAMNGGWNNPAGFTGVLDVVGFNYNPHVYQSFHTEFPDKPMIATEIASEIGTRGIYNLNHFDNLWGDKDRGYVAAYSINAGPGGQTVENAWPPIASSKYIAGGFVWSGFDYKGEPRPFGWPCINSHYGIMDLCGFPKDSYYYYQSWWSDKPVLHLFPHWNWPGKEGQTIPVWVHTNCQNVELFLNNVSLGKQSVTPLHHLEWNVTYAPGTLSAKGVYHGNPIEASVQTTDSPAAVRLIPDRTNLTADNADLSVITVKIIDAKGRLVPTASNKINFALTGPARLIGVGNGDPTCHDPDKANWRSAFNGLAQAIIQTTNASGNVTLTASADSLQPAIVQLTSR